jgi:hypothetical protein
LRQLAAAIVRQRKPDEGRSSPDARHGWQDRIRVNYRGNYDRLVEAKRTWDPDNLFHHNQNIKP